MIGSRSPVMFKLKPVASDGDGEFGGAPPFVGASMPLPAIGSVITGVSRDSAGAALGGVTCTLFKVTTQGGFPVFLQVAVVVSDGGGNYSFPVGFDGPYRVTFDLDGTPIRAAITLKTLSGG